MHSLLRSYAHKYDIRGPTSSRFGPHEAYMIGRGYASIIHKHGLKSNTVVIGHDIRDTSLSLFNALAKGLIESGMQVIGIGYCTAPMISFASILCGVSASIMVTASHNSFEYNGFKFRLNGAPFYNKALQDLCDIIDVQDFISGDGGFINKSVEALYVQNLHNTIEIKSKFKVVWLSPNRVIHSILEHVLQDIPGEHIIANTLAELGNLRYDLGFEFDTDCDRMTMLDHAGTRLDGDKTLAIFSLLMLRDYPDLRVVFDIKSSRVLIEWLKELGAYCEISRVGSCFIHENMTKIDAHLGGETSGHYMFKHYSQLADDGIYSALYMLHYLSKFDLTLDSIQLLLPELHISKSIKIPCREVNKLELLEKIQKKVQESNLVLSQNTEDAILVKNRLGWYIIRASETENALSVRCEGFDKASLDSIQNDAEELLSYVGLTIW